MSFNMFSKQFVCVSFESNNRQKKRQKQKKCWTFACLEGHVQCTLVIICKYPIGVNMITLNSKKKRWCNDEWRVKVCILLFYLIFFCNCHSYRNQQFSVRATYILSDELLRCFVFLYDLYVFDKLFISCIQFAYVANISFFLRVLSFFLSIPRKWSRATHVHAEAFISTHLLYCDKLRH